MSKKGTTMSSLSEAGKGFLWGTGFAVALLAVFSAYAVTTLSDIEWAYKNQMAELIGKQSHEYGSVLQPEILHTKKEGNSIFIASRVKSLGVLSFMKTRAYLRFTLLDKSGKSITLVSVCKQDLVPENSPGEWTYYETECKATFGELVTDVRVALAHL